MKKTTILVLVLVLGMVSKGLTAEDTWTTKANMPTAKAYFSTAVANGKIYAFGGALGGPNLGTSVVEEYDPATDTWSRVSNMPEIRFAPSTSTIDGIIYLIGGSTSLRGAGLRTVYSYDPSTDTWTQKANTLTPRQAFSASVVDGKIYTIGGWDGSRWVSTVEMYDPATDSWTRKTNMPTARFYFSSEAVNGKIYAIGGVATVNVTGPVLDTVEEYDPVTNTWSQKADMPTPRHALATGVVYGKIYAIGGGLPSGTPYTDVEQYDPMTDSWITKSPMPTPRRAFAASVVNGKIYAIGGVGIGAVGLKTVEEYDTGIPLRSPDFNSDGIVDSIDMCMLIENWQTDNPLCDIAPPPFGDGIVDVEDLKVLAEHLFEVYPYADTVDVSEADNGGQVEVELGKLLAVTLESNPSTGYQWELIENNDSVLKQFGQSEYKPPETTNPRMVGAGGSEIFRFKAVNAGQTTLKLIYHRPWEEVDPLDTFSIQVTVN